MRPKTRDILVTWNRIREGDQYARQFEQEGCPVLVAENATWGNGFLGRHWYTLAENYHNVRQPQNVCDCASCFRRWDDLGVELQPWRENGETVILPSRGIGPRCIAQPVGWVTDMQRIYGKQMRVRLHPGQSAAIPLERDLAGVSHVITWGSGAAVRALMLGCAVTSTMPNWIGAQNNTDAGRLRMFRELAWFQWELHEIASGLPFKRLLGHG